MVTSCYYGHIMVTSCYYGNIMLLLVLFYLVTETVYNLGRCLEKAEFYRFILYSKYIAVLYNKLLPPLLHTLLHTCGSFVQPC